MSMTNESDKNATAISAFTFFGVLKESFRMFSRETFFFIGFGVIFFCSSSFIRELSNIISQNNSLQQSVMFLPLRLAMRFVLESIAPVIQAITAMKVMYGFSGMADPNKERKTVFYPFVIARQAIFPILATFLLCLLFDKITNFAIGLDVKYRTVTYFTGKNGTSTTNYTISFFWFLSSLLRLIIVHAPLFGAIAAVDGRLRFDTIIPYCVKLLKGNGVVFFLLVFARIFFYLIFINAISILTLPWPGVMSGILHFLISITISGFFYAMLGLMYRDLKAEYI